MKTALTATPSIARFAPLLLRGDPAEAFALASEIGCQGVELHLRDPDDIDALAAIQLVERTGVVVPTLGTGMAAGEDGLTFSDPDEAVRREAVARVRRHINLAAHLGAAVTIGLIRGRLGSDPELRPKRRAAAVECLLDCCETAAHVGVTLLLEPLNRYECDFLYTVEETLTMIREVGAHNLKVLADTFHMNLEEVDLSTALRRAGPHLGHVHLVDSNRQAPGHGHLDLAAVLRTLGDLGFGGYLAFECLPLPDARTAAIDALTYVRAMKL